MNGYRALRNQTFEEGQYSIVPIRVEDRFDIMQWRNDQIYHLRQVRPLTEEDQNRYFENVISKLFDLEYPSQILFSYMEEDRCIGYGGLVHINWIDRNAEISFIVDPKREKEEFEFHWVTYLSLLERAAFQDLGLHKIYTYAFDLRPRLYSALEKAYFFKESTLQEHALYNGLPVDVVIHSKIQYGIVLKKALLSDMELTFQWAKNEDLRKFSFNTNPIDWQEHKTWFANKVQDVNCFYFLAEWKDRIIGSVRFDRVDDTGVISYLVDPKFQGRGFGKFLISRGIIELSKRNSGVSSVIGRVTKENKSSARVFEALAFSKNIDNDGNFEFNKMIL